MQAESALENIDVRTDSNHARIKPCLIFLFVSNS